MQNVVPVQFYTRGKVHDPNHSTEGENGCNEGTVLCMLRNRCGNNSLTPGSFLAFYMHALKMAIAATAKEERRHLYYSK